VVNTSYETAKSKHSLGGNDGYMPIKCLNLFSQDWRLKARVTKKYPMRNWKNNKGEGKILSIDILDFEGTMIQATFFNK
jgi:replication factor A1